jgi:hypothetical protein
VQSNTPELLRGLPLLTGQARIGCEGERKGRGEEERDKKDISLLFSLLPSKK